MYIYRRLCLLLGVLVLVTTLLIARNSASVKSRQIWRHAPQIIGLGDLMDEEEEEAEAQTLTVPSLLENSSSSLPVAEVNPNLSSYYTLFRPGVPKPAGSEYTKAVVMGKTLAENVTWLETAEFHDSVSIYVYHSDEKPVPAEMRTSLLTLPKYKGHEAMVYLTYIIDHYDALPDVSIFLHAHQHSWHNNELLNHDAVEMIHRLSAEHVTREGYMNLRCHWAPGCPDHLRPGIVREDKDKKEEREMARAWAIMFPGEPIPNIIAGQCCAQFAVSRARIRSVPLARFEAYRNWLLKTPLRDTISGRVFEYTWHKIFTGQGRFCPDMRVCYCDGYGVCFEREPDFDAWFEMKWKKREAERELDDWTTLVSKLDTAKEKWRLGGSVEGVGLGALEEERLRVPAVDRDVVLRTQIRWYNAMLEDRRLEALQAGRDPRVRAKIAGRPWNPGDGY